MATIFPRVGWTIDQTIEYAINTAQRKLAAVDFTVNDIDLTVEPESKAAAVKNLYLKLLNEKHRGK